MAAPARITAISKLQKTRLSSVFATYFLAGEWLADARPSHTLYVMIRRERANNNCRQNDRSRDRMTPCRRFDGITSQRRRS